MTSHKGACTRRELVPTQRKPHILLSFFLTLLVILPISGCSGLTGASIPAANSTSNTASSGALAASATSLSFGNVTTGSSSSQALTLTNSGTAPVTISKAVVTGSGFSIAGGMSSVSIAAGQSYALSIQFIPQSVGNLTGSAAVVSDAANSPLSISLNGTGMTGLSITTQPANQSITVGQTATFAVAAASPGTLTYQWKRNGVSISGGSSSTYTTPVTTSSDNGALFTVVVTDNSGSVTSNAATLTVTAASVAPSITTQPAAQTVVAGQPATFSVTAIGTATLTYQWKKNGVAISGATAASYTTSAAASDNGAQFTVTVTNNQGNLTSNAATLTVNPATFLLNASTPSLLFGSVNLGSSTTLPVTFTNAGNSNVTISTVSISGAGYAANGIPTGQILTPGQAAMLTVAFTPAATGSLLGSAKVDSSATNSPATISLSGTGIQPVAHSVTLRWTASTSAVSGYKIYRSGVSGGSYTALNSGLITNAQYADSTVLAGQMYFYVVTSVDSSNVESTFSAEVSAAVPTP